MGRTYFGRHDEQQNENDCTRDDGHKHVMILIGRGGSPDLESFATAKMVPRTETSLVCGVLVVLWSCLLLSVSGLKQDTWFLLGAGGIGMLQNVWTGETKRDAKTYGLYLFRNRSAPIIAKDDVVKDDPIQT